MTRSRPGELTIGVDLSTTPSRTGICEIDWSGRRPVAAVHSGVERDEIVQAAGRGTLAIDCPFGWPNLFADFILARRCRDRPESFDRTPLQLRETDLFVQSVIGKRPLSVSTDKLGSTAIYCANILDSINPNLDRTGGDRVIEVYPAASLQVWGHDAASGFDALLTAADLEITGESPKLLNRHCRDAIVCALTARAFDLGHVQTAEHEIPASAKQEGWIHLPSNGSLTKLSGIG